MVDNDVNRQTSHATMLIATETAQTTVEPDGHIELILIYQLLVSASLWSTTARPTWGALVCASFMELSIALPY